MDESLLRTLGWLDADAEPDAYLWAPMQGRIDPEQFDETQLRAVRDYARYLSKHNGFAICAHGNRQNYIVGESLQYEPAPANPRVPVPPAWAADMKLWLEGLQEVNNLAEMEREAVLRADRDGEFFVRVFDGDTGIPEVRFVEPEHVTSQGADAGPTERNGVVFTDGDWTRPTHYRIRTGDAPGELVPEAEVVHVKANVTSRAVRGVPTFYPVLGELTETKSLLRGLNKTAKARAKLAMLQKVAGLTRASAADIVSRLTTAATSEEVAEGPNKQAFGVERMPFGAMLRIGANDSVEFTSAQLGAQDYIDVMQAELRYIGAVVNMPEWMFTQLADQKYSNAFVSEGPTLKAFQQLQGMVTQRFGSGRHGKQASVVWRCLKRAVATGKAPALWLTAMKLSCVGPSLEARDPVGEANTNATYITNGILSKKTVRSFLNINSDDEQKQIDAEAKPPGPPTVPAVVPPVIPPVVTPPPA